MKDDLFCCSATKILCREMSIEPICPKFWYTTTNDKTGKMKRIPFGMIGYVQYKDKTGLGL